MGNWTGSPTAYAYQWKRDATNVGTNSNNYTVVAGDVGHSLTCTVTATNSLGTTTAPPSNSVAVASLAAREAEDEERGAFRHRTSLTNRPVIISQQRVTGHDRSRIAQFDPGPALQGNGHLSAGSKAARAGVRGVTLFDGGGTAGGFSSPAPVHFPSDPNSIVTVNVSTIIAPTPNTYQQTGAFVSFGGTTLATQTVEVLTQRERS